MDNLILDIAVVSIAKKIFRTGIDYNISININRNLIIMIHSEQIDFGKTHVGSKFHACKCYRTPAIYLMGNIRRKGIRISLFIVIVDVEPQRIFNMYVIIPFELCREELLFCLDRVNLRLLALSNEFIFANIICRPPFCLIKHF